MDIFQAAKEVKQHILDSIDANTTVQKGGVVAIGGHEQFLHFKSEDAAIRLCQGDGWIFSYIYRNGEVELKPIC